MIGCEDGVFPRSRSVDEGNLEEERRLCYVGLTRARKLLTLTYARRRMLFGQGSPGVPSRFLGEIPSELVERHSTAPAMGWGSSAGRSSRGGYDPLGSAAGSLRRAASGARSGVGDDIVHAAFGEGVITAVDGDQLVVRFRKKGDERRLMADFAPIQKAS